MNVNNIMNIYIYIVGLLRGGCVEKETTMAKERWWKAPGMVVLTSTKTNTVFALHWPEEPRAAHWPQIKSLARLVGKWLLMSNEGWG
jgi:hypothetical protein